MPKPAPRKPGPARFARLAAAWLVAGVVAGAIYLTWTLAPPPAVVGVTPVPAGQAPVVASSTAAAPPVAVTPPVAAAPPPAPPQPVALPTEATAQLAEPPLLLIPVQGALAKDLRDSFFDGRDAGQRGHEAIDIMAPTGTPVFAVDDGKIIKLFLSKPGGITLYQLDKTGTFAYYYAHLDAYAPGIAEGQMLKRGELLGTVGATGNARVDAPHLHFAIFRLGPEKQWWKGEPINPFTYLGGKVP